MDSTTGRVAVDEAAAAALPAVNIRTASREERAKNARGAYGFFHRVSGLRVRRALAERDLVWPYSERLRLLVHAPIDPVSDEEIAQLEARIREPRTLDQRPTRGGIRVVGMTPERALAIASAALDARRT